MPTPCPCMTFECLQMALPKVACHHDIAVMPDEVGLDPVVAPVMNDM